MYQSRANAYKTVGVQSASPERILEEVFSRIELDCERAISAIKNADVKDRCAQLGHAIKLVGALEVSLDRELAPELCANLYGLYGYVRTRLVDGNLKGDPKAVREAMELVREVHASFQAAQKAA
jgi:flagellar secretion chaperone FliS